MPRISGDNISRYIRYKDKDFVLSLVYPIVSKPYIELKHKNIVIYHQKETTFYLHDIYYHNEKFIFSLIDDFLIELRKNKLERIV